MNWVKQLSRWFELSQRELPWRENHDPYRIWISEIMLQQTTVAAVIPYYQRFLKSFPTLRKLAEAEESQVLTLWSGLGYYSRARNLHKGARYLWQQKQGRFPRTREEILEVPGIGPYTAGAILSIAFDLKVPLVDGNVQRVFARYFGISSPIHSAAAKNRFWELAERGVQSCDSPRVFNQALMELGATVCTKSSPSCERCPISQKCFARLHHQTAQLPVPKKRQAAVELHWAGFILESNGKVFLRKNPKGEWWSDLWDIPRIEVLPERRDQQAQKYLRQHHIEGIPSKLGTQKHTVTHHRIQVTPYHLHLAGRPSLKEIPGKWLKASQLKDLPLSSLVKKVLGQIYDL